MSFTSPVSKWAQTSQFSFWNWSRKIGSSVFRQAKAITPDGRLVVLARALRTFGYGFTSVLLGVVLVDAHVPPVQIGLLLTVAALGSVTSTLVMGIFADRVGRKRSLIVSALLMMGTGFLFALTRLYPLLLLAAFCGTSSPSTNDNTPFSAVEQSILAQGCSSRHHTRIFAFYNLAAQLAGALGGLLVGLPDLFMRIGLDEQVGMRGLFALYGVLAAGTALIFTRLSPHAEVQQEKVKSLVTRADERNISSRTHSLRTLQRQGTRRVVLQLASLFALDAFAGGLAVQTILAVWFRQRFGVSLGSLGLLFFGVNLLAALSFLAAPHLTKRFGMLRTMIAPHFLSNLFLLMVPVMPVFSLAAALLLLRQSLSKIDVPARQAYTMALVPPRERTAAASFTTIARSTAVSVSPLCAGLMLSGPWLVLGLPLILASGLAISYDLALWQLFKRVPLYSPPEQQARQTHPSQFRPLHFHRRAEAACGVREGKIS